MRVHCLRLCVRKIQIITFIVFHFITQKPKTVNASERRLINPLYPLGLFPFSLCQRLCVCTAILWECVRESKSVKPSVVSLQPNRKWHWLFGGLYCRINHISATLARGCVYLSNISDRRNCSCFYFFLLPISSILFPVCIEFCSVSIRPFHFQWSSHFQCFTIQW